MVGGQSLGQRNWMSHSIKFIIITTTIIIIIIVIVVVIVIWGEGVIVAASLPALLTSARHLSPGCHGNTVAMRSI